MENMPKGALKEDLNKNSMTDDDFGKEFFDSWKSAKEGNAIMDFGVEAAPKNKIASFKFDELDNFELSGNFDKLPSFNLAMPDLDFSNPSKKNEKLKKSFKEPVTGSVGTKVSKEGKFSFDFDFNSFDLDSKLSEDKRSSNSSGKNEQEHFPMQEKVQESSDNNSTSTNLAKGQHFNFVRKAELSKGKRATIPEDRQTKTFVNTDQSEHSHKNYLAKASLPDIQTDSTSSDVMGQRVATEKDDLMNPIGISPSSSSSPVDSYNPECWTKAAAKELPNSVSELHKNEGQQPLSCTNRCLTGSNEVRKDVYNFNNLKKSVEGAKSIDEKQSLCQNTLLPEKKLNSHQNIMLPSLKCDIAAAGSTKLRLMASGMELITVGKLRDNVPQQLTGLISKSFDSTPEMRTMAPHVSIITESSLQSKTSSEFHQTSKSAKIMKEPSLPKTFTRSSVDTKIANAGISTGSFKGNALAKLVSSNRHTSQIIRSSKDVTPGDSKYPCIQDSATSKKIELKQNIQNSAKPREAKMVHFLEEKMESPLIATSKTTNLPINEKKYFLHASLKRKINEVS